MVWELYKWVIEPFRPSGVRIGYTDTVVDLFAGMAGSVVAGALVSAWVKRAAKRN